MATRGPFGRDLSDMFDYANTVRKVPSAIRFYIMRYYEMLYHEVPSNMSTNCSNDLHETFSSF